MIAARNDGSPWEARITELMGRMTLRDKVGQMTQLAINVLGRGPRLYDSDTPFRFDGQMLARVFDEHRVGSILTAPNNTALTPGEWHRIIAEIQQRSMQSLGIPCLYGVDSIHGATYVRGATFFPQQINLAATFDCGVAAASAECCAREMRSCGLPWNFSPVLDLGRMPLWPRFWETFGEDPYLVSHMGCALVGGYQGDDRERLPGTRVAACLKHFVGYGSPASGKDRTPAAVAPCELEEKHLRPFREAVAAGALSVMVNSGILNGMPCHMNRALITGILKEGMHFDGVVVTDWLDIANLCERDRVATNLRQAVKLAVNAGIDLAMVPYDLQFCRDLVELVEAGDVPMERIDDAVRRILRLKFRLGLFDAPPVADGVWLPEFREHAAVARRAAAESIVLLKNEGGLLPLDPGRSLLITGPNADSKRTLNGGWTLSWQGEATDGMERNGSTVLEAFGKRVLRLSHAPGVAYSPGGNCSGEVELDQTELLGMARTADAVLVCVGENSYTEKPGDTEDLALSEVQQRLVERISRVNRNIILVLNEGRPRLIGRIEPLVRAVLWIGLPGSYGAEALADVIFGRISPSGRLPFTYPKYPHSLICHDFKHCERATGMDGAYDYSSRLSIQYPFGYGLGYTTFEYACFRASARSISPEESIRFSVEVTNRGDREAEEVVLLFISDRVASLPPDNRRLQGFRRIRLAAGQTAGVSFEVEASRLAFADGCGRFIVEEGEFVACIAGHTLSFEVTRTATIEQ